MKNLVEIIAIIAIAAFAGNMINIGMSYASYWQSIDPIAFMQDFKVKFPLLLPPTAATLLPALIATLLAVFFNWNNPETRLLWLITLFGLLLTVAITLIYHLPNNLAFMNLKYSAAKATSRLQTWVLLHWVRVVVAIAAAVFAILGFQKS
ncbi:MAG: anthrone oxygenase family protein [Elainellaceae cyanobacterium]